MKNILFVLATIFIFCASAFANNVFINMAGLNNIEQVKKHINDGVDIDAKHTDTGKTALILASERGHIEIVKLLVNSGATVDAEDNSKKTALMWASQGGNIEVAKFLIDSYANVNALDNDGKIVLFYACRNFNIEMMKLILDNGGKNYINFSDHSQWTVLIYVSMSYIGGRSADMVQLLIDYGADVNARTRDSWTALSMASRGGNTEVVKVLLAAGADVNIRHQHGFTALSSASQNGHTEIANLLMAAGAR